MRYFEHKKNNLLLVGLAWIGLSEPWWPSSISFIITLIDGIGLDFVSYVFIGNFFIPFFVLCWLLAMIDLLGIRRKKVTLTIYISISTIFEIIFLYLLFTTPALIGEMLNPVDIDYDIFIIVFLLFNLILVFSTGLFFSIRSLKSENITIRLKGKFLLIAFLSFCIGTAIDVIISTPFARIILVSSAIEFYIGYMMPDFILTLFTRSKIEE